MRTEEGKVTRRKRFEPGNPVTVISMLAASVLLAYLSYQIIRPFLAAIAWAGILAVVFAPLHQRVRQALKRDSLSAAASTIITTLVAILPIVLLSIAIAREAGQAYDHVTANINSGADVITTINQTPVIGSAWQWLQAHLKQWNVELDSVAGDALRQGGELAFGIAKGTITNLSALILNLVLVAFTLFFFFRDSQIILRYLQRAAPIKPEATHKIYSLVREVIRAAVNGVVVINTIKGLLAGLAFWALGLPSPALWGTVGALVSVIPVLGISLVWVPGAIVLLIQGHAIKALLLAIWGLTALSLIDNFLYPILVGSQVRLHTLLVFFSSLGGLAVFGFLGFVLGPVVATLTVKMIEVVSEYYRAGAGGWGLGAGEEADESPET
jgi:predicted PurR-regulated permease PerM